MAAPAISHGVFLAITPNDAAPMTDAAPAISIPCSIFSLKTDHRPTAKATQRSATEISDLAKLN